MVAKKQLNKDALHYRMVSTPAGVCWFVAGRGGLLRCHLPQKTKKAARAKIREEFPDAREDSSLLPRLEQQLQAFFKGKKVRFQARLDMSAMTPFRRRVYEGLANVASGQTTTYAELAAGAGSPKAARAVGSAMRDNPFPPIIPCHRVLGSNGALCGFSGEGGVGFKQQLLDLEALG